MIHMAVLLQILAQTWSLRNDSIAITLLTWGYIEPFYESTQA